MEGKSGASLTIGKLAFEVYARWFKCGSCWCSRVYLYSGDDETDDDADEEEEDDDIDGDEWINLLELTNVNKINIINKIIIDLINERHFFKKTILYVWLLMGVVATFVIEQPLFTHFHKHSLIYKYIFGVPKKKNKKKKK